MCVCVCVCVCVCFDTEEPVCLTKIDLTQGSGQKQSAKHKHIPSFSVRVSDITQPIVC